MKRLFVIVSMLLMATPARAAQASGQSTAVALIVTNNRSAQLGRPDLRYADDDGAKYYEFFRMIAPPDQVVLLTDFDADTARLFPDLTPLTRTPSRAHIEEAAATLTRKVDALRTQGRAVDFYFIYAGHGDIDRGRGFIELTDSALNSDDLDTLIFQRVHADHTHVILDSCNSFFVLNPRKPGGRRFPTPTEVAAQLAQRMPNVGVFLSTSAEAQVYEWSELQSGIFSHAVRSGLMGAADANGDGQVSYSELAAFVNLAAKDVRNPLYRPTVFARGPGGENDLPVVDLTHAHTAMLEVPAGAEQRLTIRDGDELPWIDLHTEANARMQLHLPERVSERTVVQLRTFDSGGSIGRREGVISTDEVTLLAQLSPAPEREDARGPDELFRALFSRPFGPTALAAYLTAEKTDAPPAIGIAQEDITRMRLLLRHTAELDRARRLGMAVSGYVVGTVAVTLGGVFLAQEHNVQVDPGDLEFGLPLLGAAAGSFVLATVWAARPSLGERIFADFENRMSKPMVDQAQVAAETEQQLFRLYRVAHRTRIAELTLGWLLAGLGSVGLGLTSTINFGYYSALFETLFAFPAIAGISIGIQGIFETPIERMVRLWSEDPGIQRIPGVGLPASSGIPRIGLAATPGGMSFALSGTF